MICNGKKHIGIRNEDIHDTAMQITLFDKYVQLRIECCIRETSNLL